MSTSANKPNIVFWIVGVLALLWNLAGCSQFFMQAMNSEAWRASMTPERLEMMDRLPLFYIVVFAIAVFGSTLACIFLLARRKLAVPLFLVGLIAVVIQSGYSLFFSEAKGTFTTGEVAITVILPLVSAALYFYARNCEAKGWLK